jgi:hypothetical protein
MEQLLQDQLNELFSKDAILVALVSQYKRETSKGMFVQATQTKAEVSKRMDVLRQGLESTLVEEKTNLGETLSKMSPEDRDKCILWVNAIPMLSDWIELLSMNVNEVVKKYSPDVRVSMYDQIIKLGKEAKKHVEFMGGSTSMSYRETFADNSDEMMERFLVEVKGFLDKTN